MIYGALWDATMQWYAKSNIPVGYTGEDTRGFGNYRAENVIVANEEEINSTIIKVKGSSGKVLETGQVSYTRIKNIYDLSGNYNDWTQEGCSNNYRVARGGDYSSTSSYAYTSYRDNQNPMYENNFNTSRPQLYIK